MSEASDENIQRVFDQLDEPQPIAAIAKALKLSRGTVTNALQLMIECHEVVRFLAPNPRFPSQKRIWFYRRTLCSELPALRANAHQVQPEARP